MEENNDSSPKFTEFIVTYFGENYKKQLLMSKTSNLFQLIYSQVS